VGDLCHAAFKGKGGEGNSNDSGLGKIVGFGGKTSTDGLESGFPGEPVRLGLPTTSPEPQSQRGILELCGQRRRVAVEGLWCFQAKPLLVRLFCSYAPCL
jgi:hypothetical protein